MGPATANSATHLPTVGPLLPLAGVTEGYAGPITRRAVRG